MVDLSGGKTLYEAIGLSKDATQAEIRKAYLKLAVQLHPDKNPGDEQASERFQTLQRVYAVLSDEERRRVYDQTGSLGDSEELAGEKFSDLYDYYRGVYAKVTEADVATFESSFRGGGEEAPELLRYYEQFQGDMRRVFGWVMCSYPDRDSHRFMDIIDAAVREGSAKKYKPYTAWAKKVAATPRPADPLAPPAAIAGGGGKKRRGKGDSAAAGDEMALVAQIRGRQANAFGSLLSQLEAKYGGGSGSSRRENMPGEPSEEEFMAARQRMEQRTAAAASGSGGGSKRAGKKAKK